MSKGKPTPPDGAKKLGDNNNDDDFTLDPGQALTAQVLAVNPKSTDYGSSAVLTLDPEEQDSVVELFCRAGLKAAYNRGDIQRGNTYWIHKEADESSYQGNDYHDIEVHLVDE